MFLANTGRTRCVSETQLPSILPIQKMSNFKDKMFSTDKKILLQGIAMRNMKTLALTVEDLLESIRLTSPSSVAR